MIPSEEQVHIPIVKVKIDEKISKTKAIEEHVENIKELQVCE